MMMQMLVAGNIDALTDDKREADESNPKGYFEHEAVKSLANPSADKNWLYGNEGKVVKIVAPLLKHLPEDIPTRIIFMQRDVNEILRSHGPRNHRFALRERY